MMNIIKEGLACGVVAAAIIIFIDILPAEIALRAAKVVLGTIGALLCLCWMEAKENDR